MGLVLDGTWLLILVFLAFSRVFGSRGGGVHGSYVGFCVRFGAFRREISVGWLSWVGLYFGFSCEVVWDRLPNLDRYFGTLVWLGLTKNCEDSICLDKKNANMHIGDQIVYMLILYS